MEAVSTLKVTETGGNAEMLSYAMLPQPCLLHSSSSRCDPPIFILLLLFSVSRRKNINHTASVADEIMMFLLTF